MDVEALRALLVGLAMLLPIVLAALWLRSLIGVRRDRMWRERARVRGGGSERDGRGPRLRREPGHCPSCGRETEWEYERCGHCARKLPDP